MWAEVTVPYVDLILDNPPARAPWLQYVASINLPARFYYSQIVWADQIRVDESGQVWYRLNEKYGSGDIFWGQAEAFRPLTAEEISPINPDAPDKRDCRENQGANAFLPGREQGSPFCAYFQWRVVRCLGRPRGCVGNASWRISHLAQGNLPTVKRRQCLRRLESACSWLGQSVRGDRSRHPLDLLAQQLWRAILTRLRQCQPRGREMDLSLVPASGPV